jgi:hypothetical protein
VLHATVDDQHAERVADRHRHDLLRPAVEAQRVPGLPEADCELIHDSAGHTGKVVLGLLAEQRFLGEGKRPTGEGLHDGGRRHLERGAGTQAPPGRKRRADLRIESADHESASSIPLDHPSYVIRPVPPDRRDRLTHVERHGPSVTLRPQHRQAIATGPDIDRHVAIDRHRQDDAVVVVGVFADEIDPTWGTDGERPGGGPRLGRHRGILLVGAA